MRYVNNGDHRDNNIHSEYMSISLLKIMTVINNSH
jgi:hypothetical protein